MKREGPMNDRARAAASAGLVFEQDIDEAPDKVWRAVSIPAYRDRWLPQAMLAEAEAVAVTPGQEVRYRLREDEPPFMESMVIVQVAANAAGGTRLTIIHTLAAGAPRMKAANANGSPLMLAA